MPIDEGKRRTLKRHILPVTVLSSAMIPVAFFTRHLAWPLPLVIIGVMLAIVLALAVRAFKWIRANRDSLQ